MIERYTLPEMGQLWSEENKYRIWLKVELAAVAAQAELGYIPRDIPAVLEREVKLNLERILEIEAEVHHDVIAFLTSLTENLGPEGRYIHYGLTSSDVVDTGLSLLLKEALNILLRDIDELVDLVKSRAFHYKNTLTIGRTHGVHAEPTTFGFKLLVWYEELLRQKNRLEKALDEIAVAKFSGAVGNYSNIDPQVEELASQKLGLRPAGLTTQVISRDRHAFVLTVLANLAATIEKMAVEIRHLQRTEVLEVEEPFVQGQKGSSAMPHKRNPILSERLTGLARLIRSNAQAALENIALWHERDISHSSVERVIMPDATIVLDYMLVKMADIIRGLQVYPDNMRANLEKSRGLVFSQRVLLALVGKGLTREDAYKIVQRNAMKTWSTKVDFKTNLLEDEEVKAYLTKEEIEACFDINYYLRHIDQVFARFQAGTKTRERV